MSDDALRAWIRSKLYLPPHYGIELEWAAFCDPERDRVGRGAFATVNGGRLVPHTMRYFVAFADFDGNDPVAIERG